MNDEPLRILIADDNGEFRHSLEALLCTMPNLTAVGSAPTGSIAVRLANELQPDIILMDLEMPEVNGIEATRRIVAGNPHIHVIVLTMFDDDDAVFAAIRSGARGYLLKGAGRDEILRAVRAVANREAIFGPGIAQRIRDWFAAIPPGEPFPQLSKREREVLALVAEGCSNEDITKRLYMELSTVRNHINRIFKKLEVTNRANAIILARDAGVGRGAGSRWEPS
jgi:DNA-binding NarL/FixJ family response regulator